jgi:putative ABC transport system permease protein
MLSLALSSLRYRSSAFVAVFLAVFLGATMVMSFGSMLDTALGPGVDPLSEETLIIMAGVVGGWSLLLVMFAVASTTSLGVRQRAREIALLKSVGATPGQLYKMIVAEVLVLAVIAMVPAVPLGMLAGSGLLALLQDTGQVASGIDHAFGVVALGQGFGITLISSVGGAMISARRAVRVPVVESLMEAAAPKARLNRRRVVLGLLFFAAAMSQAVLTVTLGHGVGFEAQQYAGVADIVFAIGLACFAPALVHRIPLPGFGVAGYLTRQNLRERTAQLASPLTSIILFVAASMGTLYMQYVDNRASEGVLTEEGQRTVETLNYVVTGMITLFLCIMLINTLVATTSARTREFAQHRLIGATPQQVLGVVGLESLALTVTGVVFGTIAALVTILPFSYARTDSWTPSLNPAIVIGVIGVAAAATFATTLLAARRALSIPAVAVVTT